jgi:hypothetical protein
MHDDTLKLNKWENKGGGVLVLFAKVPFESLSGKKGRKLSAFRIDSRGDSFGKIRVDRTDAVAGTWTPWEAIDDGHGVASIVEGKKLVARYRRGRRV